MDFEPVGTGDDRPGTVPTPRRAHTRLVLAGVAAAVIALDILTKCLVVAKIDPEHPVRIIGDAVTLRLIRNSGAAFSMATGMTWVLSLIAIGVIVWVIRMGSRLQSLWWAVGLGLVVGGASGNLIDRIFRSPGVLRGHVVDFVSVGWWPVFNVADSAICCAAVLLVGLTVFGRDPYEGFAGGTREKETNDA
ncbi:signal peptidase II [Tsukamurella sp. 8F]|uniref:signal peptidase II n=1 Tax=unclassified Tsukamurella TaxID=2633480 RepID=UPI0023B8BD93|nr:MULTISPECIES: signal peptidase II [unclassified Tsukamurella]MDF0532451.1 signal peptidase II [Tsukamurella sp. 8J]MDF0588462.1 signal peptidase II [Tsukamurella sp. 8F]